MSAHRIVPFIAFSLFALPALSAEDAPPAEVAGEEPPPVEFRFDRPSAKPQVPVEGKRMIGGGVILTGGYDSNILIENTDLATATDAKGFAWSAEGRVVARLVQGPTGKFTIGGSAELDSYPSEHTADLVRYGVFASGSAPLGGVDVGVTAGFNHFRINDEPSADVLNVNPYLTKVFERHVAIGGIGIQRARYRTSDDSSGTLVDASYHHWCLLESNNVNRRIEAGLRIGRNQTSADVERYTLVVPTLGVAYRFVGGSRPGAGTVDGRLRTSLEWRSYSEDLAGERHRNSLWQVQSQIDRWWNDWLSTGAYAGFNRRGSTSEPERYDRFQAGLRLAATW